MGGSSKKVTVGYKYYAGIHLIFCNKVDKLLKIFVGERELWSGDVTANTQLSLEGLELFGGEKREGGVNGPLDVCFGESDQPRNPYLVEQLGSLIPAFRGLFGFIGNQLYLSANNPYIKSWSTLCQRTSIGWREDLEAITMPDGYLDMNPAHIIRECLTDTTWGGLGYPVADLDNASFETAANLLFAEDFGMALLWSKQVSIFDFIQTVLDHIDGKLYFSHVTGLLTIKLVRNDYDSGGLPTFDTSNIVEMVEFQAPSVTEAVNNVVITYIDRDNEERTVTVQDLSGILRVGGQLNTANMSFDGIADATLANNVAVRELLQLSVPLGSLTIVVNRTYSYLEPGSVFNLTWSPLGVENLVFRVNSVEFGTHTDNKIRIQAIRDVYGTTLGTLSAPANTIWVNPIGAPAESPEKVYTEINWWQFVTEYLGDSQAVLDELTDSSTLIIAFCKQPSGDAIDFELWSRNTGATDWEFRDIDSYPYIGVVSEAVVQELTSTILLSNFSIDTELVLVGEYAYLGEEIVSVVSISQDPVSVVVNRGIFDTVVTTHDIGTSLFFSDGLKAVDTTDRVVGESVELKILPSTGQGRFDITEAATTTLVLAGRMMRPYPPGNVKINGSAFPEFVNDELTFTWSHRSRELQTTIHTTQDTSDIGPEAGTTYSLKIYGEAETLLRTETGISGTSYTYLLADEIADSGLSNDRLNSNIRIELWSVRGSLTSLFIWDISTIRPLPPENLTLPVITGSTGLDDTLTVSDGTWEFL